MIKYFVITLGFITIASILYFEQFDENNQNIELIETIENISTKEIETKNKILIEKKFSSDEAKVFDNKDISDLSSEYTDVELEDAVDVPFDIPVSEFMLELIPHKELELYNVNTQEKLEAVFWVAGDYVPKALDELNQFMRDWRRNQIVDIDPDLYKLLHDLYNEVDAEKPIQLISGHRSEKTNNSLRAQGRNTAKKSQHVLGKAADIMIPGVPVKELREEALELERGGVGYYPNDNFVHVDTGRVRQWSE